MWIEGKEGEGEGRGVMRERKHRGENHKEGRSTVTLRGQITWREEVEIIGCMV